MVSAYDQEPLLAHVEGSGDLEVRGRQAHFHASGSGGGLTFSTHPVDEPLFVLTASPDGYLASSSGSLPVLVNGSPLDAPRPVGPGDRVEVDGSVITLAPVAVEKTAPVPPPGHTPLLATLPGKGRRFGRYQIQAELGRGAFGAVYRAFDPELERLVALKVLLRPTAAAKKRFEREVRATARLRHPNIVAVHDCGEHGDRPFLVMDFVAGQTLEALASARGGLEARRAAQLVRDLARALEYAHAEGILHRDLKPQNVMVDRRGQGFVADFGLARLKELAGHSLTASGHMLGTPLYMPLEQAMGERVDERADVYALGGVLYFALTGRPHRAAMTMDELMRALHHLPPPPSELCPGLPRDMDRICARALAPDVAARYQSAGDLADDLERFLAGVALSPSRAPQVAVRLVGLGVLLAGVVASAAILARGEGRPVEPAPSPNVAASPDAPTPESSGAPTVGPSVLEALEPELVTPAPAGPPPPGWEQAQRELEARDWEAALRSCGRVLEEDSRFVPALVGRGRAFKALQRYAPALAELDRALELDPRNLEGLEQRAVVHIYVSDHRAALADAEAGVRLVPDSKRFVYLKAVCLVELDQEAAIVAIGRLIELDSRSSTAWSLRGTACLRLGRNREAAESLRKATELAPKDAELWLNFGVALRRAGLPDQALEALGRAKALAPRSSKILIRRAGNLVALGRFEEALAEYDMVLAAKPNSAAAWSGSGDAFSRRELWEEAHERYSRALELEPDRAAALTWRGICRLRLGLLADAQGDLERAVALDPSLTLAWTFLGTVRCEQGEVEAGLETYDQVLERDPVDLETLKARGKLRGLLGKLTEARADLDLAVREHPAAAEAWALRARIRLQQGDAAGAAEDAKASLALDPSSAVERMALDVLAELR
jgi:tetratricopeptide (TPR) repeat protein